jgi:hypothetical protein
MHHLVSRGVNRLSRLFRGYTAPNGTSDSGKAREEQYQKRHPLAIRKWTVFDPGFPHRLQKTPTVPLVLQGKTEPRHSSGLRGLWSGKKQVIYRGVLEKRR